LSQPNSPHRFTVDSAVRLALSVILPFSFFARSLRIPTDLRIMRLLTILPWAIALGLVSYTKPALSRAVAPSDSDSSVAAAAIALAPGAFTASQSQHNVHPATSRRDRRHIENRYVSRHAYDQRDKLAGVPDKKDANIKDDYWDDRVNAGCNLLAAMNSDDKAAAFYVGQEGSAESAWKNYGTLR
jgi:hypothetical protein